MDPKLWEFGSIPYFLGGNAGFMGLYHQPYDLLLPRSAASKIVTGRGEDEASGTRRPLVAALGFRV